MRCNFITHFKNAAAFLGLAACSMIVMKATGECEYTFPLLTVLIGAEELICATTGMVKSYRIYKSQGGKRKNASNKRERF